MENISQRIYEILNAADWSQEQLARALDVPQKSVSEWANNKAVPRAESLAKINDLYAKILGADTFDPAYLVKIEKRALSRKLTAKDVVKNLDILEAITINLTYHTGTIEGSTMTLEDVREVLEDSNLVLANRPAREQIEARNHRAALFFLLDELNRKGKDFRWTEDLLLGTHLRLMNSVLPNAGQYRNHGVHVSGSHAPRANYLSVQRKIQDLFSEMNTETDNIMERLAESHATFEQIHPFSDGNGRTGRLILFIEALKYGVVPPLVAKERKKAYYKYLEIAHTTGEYELLRIFLAESILYTVRIINSQKT